MFQRKVSLLNLIICFVINAKISTVQACFISEQLTNVWGIYSNFNDLRKTPSEMINEYNSGKINDDIELKTCQLLKKHGLKPEKHTVTTEDGYILKLYRIPRNGTVVFLMHGFVGSSDDFVIGAGPENAIPYYLAQNNYDVWLGNARGNKYGRKHQTLSPKQSKFWRFTWDDIGRYDLPASIDYILKTTGRQQLKIIGHSQGNTAAFVMLSEKPEYNQKVALLVALSPVVFMTHMKSPLVRVLKDFYPYLPFITNLFSFYEFVPNSPAHDGVVRLMCGGEKLAQRICGNLIFVLTGFNHEQMNTTNLPVVFSHSPAGASIKLFIHYGQGLHSGKFRRFDYGEKGNLNNYGLKFAPEYPVNRIKAPVALFYSTDDWLASVKDVETLRSKLPNVITDYKVPNENFKHIDFLWAKDLKKLIVDRLLEVLELASPLTDKK